MSNPTLRIFLSSTAVDMVEYRKKASEALLKLENMPVQMDYFGAVPNESVQVCKDKVRTSNALILMLAHRYGWVPSKEEGGDGKKSITWIEVETALENRIPIFAFIIDKDYAWTQPTEEEQLRTAKDKEEALVVFARVTALQEFKTFINTQAKLTRTTFTTPDVLALNVATSIANWIINASSTPSITSTATMSVPIVFREVHHLQPAPHFRGRKKLLDDLNKWWNEPVTADRVLSLVAIGGTGKTAIAQKFINTIRPESRKGSVLVWSFYDDPNTDAFIREACITFTGIEPDSIGGRLEYLQRALGNDNRQNLIVLDGLERVQSEGKGSQYAKGDLEDHRLKNLLLTIAKGLGNTRALITSRFKLNNLAQLEGAGYRSRDLDVLDAESAKEVLRAWNVQGTNEELKQLAKSVGYHALSVSVLGSYLNHYCSGSIEGAKEFKLDEFKEDDTQAARLGRILGGYAKNLADAERDLLVRLSVFPNGVSINILIYLIEAGGEIAGAMIGFSQPKLAMIAERLKQQGLIYSYHKENSIIYTAHPFLRDYFRSLLNVKPENIHEAVMNKLAIGLDTKPIHKPIDTETLDRYEELIEHTILAGHYQDACNLFKNTMGGGGGHIHLFHTVCDYGRIIRISSLFTKDGRPETLIGQLSDVNSADLINFWGLASHALGDLKTTKYCYDLVFQIGRKLKNSVGLASDLVNLANLEISQGFFSNAIKDLKESRYYWDTDYDDHYYWKQVFSNAFACFAYSYLCLGNISKVETFFDEARKVYNGTALISVSALFEIDFLIKIGNKERAIERVNENFTGSRTNPRDISYVYYQIGILSLPDSISNARKHLDKLREWTDKSGYMDCIILGHCLATNIAYYSEDYSTALSEAQAGLNQAEGCGFGQYIIDLRLLLAKINLAIPDYTAALGYARKAFELSAQPDYGYAWGEADGLHFSGMCHRGLGEYELAGQRFTAALAIREKIGHPEVEETRRFLNEQPPLS